jgi:integrase
MAKIRLPYLKSYRSDGKTYHYVRRRGRPAVRIDAQIGTQEFMLAYQAALDSEPAKLSAHRAGSFGSLVTSFYGSAEFANLKPNSKKTYRLILESVASKHGHRPAATMPASVAEKLIQEIGAGRAAMANLSRRVLHRLMGFAIRQKIRTDNPFAGIPAYKVGTHHTWTDAELAAFESKWPLGTRERLAYALLLYTGQRVGDVSRMRRQDIANGAINVVQEKTGVPLVIPIHSNLRAAMKAGPSKGMALIGDVTGRQISACALTALMKRAARDAGLPSCCRPHGLRKAMMRRLADRGGTTKELQSISGHKTLTEVQRYTDAADQRLLSVAAMGKLENESV